VGGASPIHARKVFFTTGADPKTLDLGLPTVPLDCALDPKRLSAYIRPSDSVLVVGTMHSGCLVIDNLLQLGARTTALYNTASPFYFDRDGDYDGLKREAAEIADKIQQGLYKDSLQLVSTQDLSTVVRAAKRADWAIYCMGFAPRSGISIQVDGTSIPTVSYDGDTGAIHGCPSAWGFGVGFPNRAPDGVHWDVSVAAFVIHMANQLSTIFTTKE
jgi:hypothetical protein